ncbi:unnamed protein product [Adineta steineri]|uniref:Uncharacterized protein n=1 Tax=Adineta steineri TaxID=433720 RepID=A0A816FBI6_9BILA|nr:unnamed protein product [Adineta steineri]CAF1658184.1 unnamed protein product [Adineta steineri]
MKNINIQTSFISNITNSQNFTISTKSLTNETNKYNLTFTNSILIYTNRTLETKVQCIGSLYNQSCLFQNLYYVDNTFTILIVKGSYLPEYSIRTNAFYMWPTKPIKREFDSYNHLQIFVRNITNPRRIPYVTLYFGQLWLHNIGHALFDGLYPAYVALIRFSPRHLHPFRILADIGECQDCWSEDVYSRFAGLGIIKQFVLNKLSKGRWFVFDEVVMGSGTFCQRCTQPNYQLSGGIEFNASRLFRDRMYQQHGFIHPVIRQKSSLEYRTSHDILQTYFIDNKRFTKNDRREINAAIIEINNYTNFYINKTKNNTNKLEWPLINVTYLYYKQVKAQNMSSIQINATPFDSRPPTYELIENDFIAQLKVLREMDIHITGPGTGQMYQTFLSDGSVSINVGGLRSWKLNNKELKFTSYLEQYMTSGTPYIKGLYYPINERANGIKKDEVIKLIRQAGQLILQGFSLPVEPRENLAPDGQLFVEMCEKDKKFCSFVTTRSPDKQFKCLEIWAEDLVQEYNQWNDKGFIVNGKNIRCPFNHSLLRDLRKKYDIKHYLENR